VTQIKNKIRNSAEHLIRFEHVYKDLYLIRFDGNYHLALHVVGTSPNTQGERSVQSRISIYSDWIVKETLKSNETLAQKIRDREIEILDGSIVNVEEVTKLILQTSQARMRIESAENKRRHNYPTNKEKKEERDRIIALITYLVTEKSDLVNARAWAELYKIPQTEVDDIAFRRTRNVRDLRV